MKRRRTYLSPATLQQVEVLLEIGLLENSGHGTNEVIESSGIKAGASDYGTNATYGADAWD